MYGWSLCRSVALNLLIKDLDHPGTILVSQARPSYEKIEKGSGQKPIQPVSPRTV